MDVFCKSRGELTKHFLALKNYRNSIKYNRDMNELYLEWCFEIFMWLQIPCLPLRLVGFCRHALRCKPHTCGWVRLDWCAQPKYARGTAHIRS